MLLAASSGLYLYQTKHRTRLLDKQIETTLEATEAVHERTRLLNAEWALLNDPSRLGELANKFLNLRPVAPGQFITMAELDKHLPPVRDFPPSGALPAEPAPEVPMAAALPTARATPPAPTTAQAAAQPAAPTGAPRPTQLAAATPAKPVLRPLAEPAEPKPEAPMALPPPRALAHAATPARREPGVAALVAQRPATAANGVGPVAGPMPTPVSNPVMMNPGLSRVLATSAPTHVSGSSALGTQAISRVGYTGSVLGNAQTTLAPPVPIASALGSTGMR
jgi:hypothetical protein